MTPIESARLARSAPPNNFNQRERPTEGAPPDHVVHAQIMTFYLQMGFEIGMFHM